MSFFGLNLNKLKVLISQKKSVCKVQHFNYTLIIIPILALIGAAIRL